MTIMAIKSSSSFVHRRFVSLSSLLLWTGLVLSLPWSTLSFQFLVPFTNIVGSLSSSSSFLLQPHRTSSQQQQQQGLKQQHQQHHHQQQQQEQQRRLRHRHRRLRPLFYRELDEDDTDTTMLKVQTRTPIGFDMRQNLQQRPEQQQQQQTKNALNIPLIRALLLNQVLILTIATAISALLLLVSDGPSAFAHLDELLHWSTSATAASAASTATSFSTKPTALLQGLAGAIPLIALGNWIENSDNRAFANVNFSTIVMTMTLFGRRRAPPDDFIPDRMKETTILTTSTWDALVQSFLLSSLTGFCEESIFRVQLPALLTHVLQFNIPLAIFSQALLFGLGHAQPNSSRMENSILIGLQFMNGITLGLLYVLVGGNIVPCMIAHALYDFVTFFKTWIDANAQLEYAEDMYLKPLPRNVEAQVRRVVVSGGTNNNVKMLDPLAFKVIKRLFYIFDFDKNQTLSRSEVRKGISYMALEKAGIPPPQEIVDRAFDQVVNTRDITTAATTTAATSERDRNRLSFADFIRLYTIMYNLVKVEQPQQPVGASQ